MIYTNLFTAETQEQLYDDDTYKNHSVSLKEAKRIDNKDTQKEITKETSVSYKTLRNYTIGAATLVAGVVITPFHHVQHAVTHAVLGPVISKTIINPVNKILGVEASHTNHHEHDADNTTSSNILSNVFHGVIHHLATQIVFDKASKLIGLGSHHKEHK